jgi:oxygen-independent coproporphyrinogen-3 oxidase
VHRGVRLSEDDLIRRAVIQELMCHELVDCESIGARFGINFKRYFRVELERLQNLQGPGLTFVRNGCIGITDAGRLLTRTVAMVFDAYLARNPSEAFSKVI